METANLRGVVLTVVSTVLGGCELPPLLVDTYGPERVSLYGAPVAMSERDASSGRWLPFDGGLPRSNGPRAEREGMFSHWGYYGSAVPEGALLGFVLGSASEGSQLVMTRARPVDERETRSARVAVSSSMQGLRETTARTWSATTSSRHLETIAAAQLGARG